MDNKTLRIIALQNAIKYEGKASAGSVIGVLLSQDPTIKETIKTLGKEIATVVAEVNMLSLQQQTDELTSIDPTLLEQKKKEKRVGLPPLKNAEQGKVVMRFEPSPSGPLSIGHAYVISLNLEHCRTYEGKFILRIGDTNPDNIYTPAYKMIPEEMNWLTDHQVAEFYIQSERMESYYAAMEKLLAKDVVYICTCVNEDVKKLLEQKMGCPCRDLPRAEQQARWKKMFDSYKEGEAVVRLKTDLNNNNPAMRDFPLFRINESPHAHVGTKYRVWPLMNMAVSTDDMNMKITHVLRAKDHADNAKRQAIMHGYLDYPTPVALFVGRINFDDMPVSCSQTRKSIEEGKYTGWDDIRVPFIAALKKRGYQPRAFVDYAVSVGVSLADKKVSQEEFYKQLNHFNKQIIDPASDRYFFVWDPVKLHIPNAPKQTITLDLHSEYRKGGRTLAADDLYYICKEDAIQLHQEKLYRLMDCVNFFVDNHGLGEYHSTDYMIFKSKGAKIIHWLPANSDLATVEVMMTDHSIVKGFGEPGLKKLEVGAIVQLERFGFCRLVEKTDDTLHFWFTHK